jgi:hypothetical protein
MVVQKRNRTQKKFRYFFLNNKLHKVIRMSRSKDQVVAWCYDDKKRLLYSYIDVQKNMQNAYTVKQVGQLLNRHKITLEEYILQGKISEPKRIYPIGNPDSKWSQFMFSESDILKIHEYILEAGNTKNIPSRSELIALLKNNMILYTKTEDGKFVPVWKAE